jgi:hypothetical protein
VADHLDLELRQDVAEIREVQVFDDDVASMAIRRVAVGRR